MFWVSVKYVKGECLSLVLQKLNMGDHCEVFSPLEGSVLCCQLETVHFS